MGYFFRRSARIGPFRLNFSKSGIGASVGVKGARLTMTPRGTTYVTVGSHGFYYRETLPRLGSVQPRTNAPASLPPHPGRSENVIASASASDLVDSSSERLIQQLNERARMFNPAWLLYMGAAMSLCGLAMLPTTPPMPTFPNLPDVSRPFSAERASNTIDEYAMLTARFGEPDSILITETPVPVGTARYNSVFVDILFVPVGCVGVYEQVVNRPAGKPRHPLTPAKSATKSGWQCRPSPNSGWTTIKYINSVENYAIQTDIATSRLDRIVAKRTLSPIVEHQGPQRIRLQPRPEMRSDSQSRAAVERLMQEVEHTRHSIETTARQVVYFGAAIGLGALGLFVAGIFVHQKNNEKRTSRLFYELDETERQKFAVVHETFAHLAKSHCIWRIRAESSTTDWKRNAGASSLVKRVPITVGCSNPQRVQTNVAVPCVNMGHDKLFFLPDVVLYWQDGNVGAIAYHDLRIEQAVTRFIEDGFVPADAIIVDRTWRYVNKSGGPDRRFNNNAQLPIAQYGVLVLTSSKGLNIRLNTSNAQMSLAAANCWRNINDRTGKPQARQSTVQGRVETPSGPRAQAFKMLGLNADASAPEISAAYRNLAQMYHPDKVAGLAPEFQTLADKRMKEINAAYELLKGRGDQTQNA